MIDEFEELLRDLEWRILEGDFSEDTYEDLMDELGDVELTGNFLLLQEFSDALERKGV